MDAATVEELHAEYLAAKERNRVLTERYNREYKAGKWSTNRPLAGRCEDAYSDEYRCQRAYEEARDALDDAENARRAERFFRLTLIYGQSADYEPGEHETLAIDMLADFRHWCDEYAVDAGRVWEQSAVHHAAEADTRVPA